MNDDVRWAKAWERGHVHGHAEVRSYWGRQWTEIDPHVTATSMAVDENGRVLVEVDQKVRSLSGDLLARNFVQHAFTLRNNLIAQFDILTP